MTSLPVNWTSRTHRITNSHTSNEEHAVRAADSLNNNGVAAVGGSRSLSPFSPRSPLLRYGSTDPMWEEVDKRYQQILQKEHQLLNSSFYSEEQTASSKKHDLAEENGNSLPTPKAVEGICTDLNKGTRYSREGKDFDLSPKIARVYSLNPSLPTQKLENYLSRNEIMAGLKSRESSGTNRNSPDVMISRNGGECLFREDTLTKVIDIAEHVTAERPLNGSPSRLHARKRTRAVVADFIDLTNDEDESNDGCSNWNKTEKKGTNFGKNGGTDRDSQIVIEQTNRGKNMKHVGSRIFRGNRDICTSRDRCKRSFESSNIDNDQSKDSAISSKSDDSTLVEKSCFDSCNLQKCRKVESNGNESKISDKCKEKRVPLHKSARRQDDKSTFVRDPREKKSNCTSNDGSGSPLDVMRSNKLRENKIIDLKARLAKQEEKLVKLKTPNGCMEQGIENGNEASEESLRMAHVAAVHHAMEGKRRSNYNEAEQLSVKLPDPLKGETESNGNVNHFDSFSSFEGLDFERDYQEETANSDERGALRNICQHVIKSISIMESRMSKTDALKVDKTEKILSNNRSRCSNNIDINRVNPVEHQDQFLLQLGLSRRYSVIS